MLPANCKNPTSGGLARKGHSLVQPALFTAGNGTHPSTTYRYGCHFNIKSPSVVSGTVSSSPTRVVAEQSVRRKSGLEGVMGFEAANPARAKSSARDTNMMASRTAVDGERLMEASLTWHGGLHCQFVLTYVCFVCWTYPGTADSSYRGVVLI